MRALLFGLAAWVAVTACAGGGGSGNPITCMSGGRGGFTGFVSGGPGTGGDGPLIFPIAGDSITRTVVLSGTPCTGLMPSVRIEVRDPLNQVLPFTATPLDGGFPLTTEVSFTPMLAGVHHLSAFFEPSLSNVQRDLTVVADKQFVPREEFAKFVEYSECVSVEQLNDGTLICGETGRVRVFKNGTEQLQRSGANYARGGTALWVLDTGQLYRFRLDTFAAEPAMPVPSPTFSSPGAAALVATDDTLWLVSGLNVRTVKFVGGALSVSEPVSWPNALGILPAATRNSQGTVLAAQGEDFYCQVDASLTGAANCTPMNGRVAGSEPGVLWSMNFTTRLLRRVVVADAPGEQPKVASVAITDGLQVRRPVEIGPLPWGSAPRLQRTTPFFADVIYVPAYAEARGIVLERYFKQASEEVREARFDQVRLDNGNGKVIFAKR